MSYRPMVYVHGGWNGNGLRFATEAEALRSAQDLMNRWMLVESCGTEESDDPVNYAIVDNQLVRVVEGAVA